MKILMLSMMLAVTGCTNTLPTQADYKPQDSYRHFSVETIGKYKGVSWYDDGFKLDNYSAVELGAVTAERKVEQAYVSQNVVETLRSELEQLLRKQMGSLSVESSTKSNQILEIAVDVQNIEGVSGAVKPTDFIPIGAVIDLAKVVSGTRDRNLRLIVSVELIESESQRVIGKRLFVINDKGVLENRDSEITVKLLEPDVQEISDNVSSFIRHLHQRK
ncbi:DUF3313 domain-containing protein [Vibrio sp. ZSDZ65]|uniref:DUF3313 domain-containing protein n=1 Tax=Vibrio qingdaonensis TaxID=2829491 RepID=A0A9X3HX32_9VIBR|nr:DUF3313 family protein [Vibrio qingdaonensis]MCW8346387.1 DUF3313 domain-containing protein [Vibrio qingdaonensis]